MRRRSELLLQDNGDSKVRARSKRYNGWIDSKANVTVRSLYPKRFRYFSKKNQMREKCMEHVMDQLSMHEFCICS